MTRPEPMTQGQIQEVLHQAAESHTRCEISYTTHGRWYKRGMQLAAWASDTVGLEPLAGQAGSRGALQADLPVNVAFQHGYYTILFETVVSGVEGRDGEQIWLEMPQQAERLERRAYRRVAVPADLHVTVEFWHRGYTDQDEASPPQKHWQGTLKNLSVGGAQVTISLDQTPNFRVHQVVGLQFTPGPHETPVRVESHVIHLAEQRRDQVLTIGVEFLGLEAHGEPRRTLHRLREIVESYDSRNRQLQPA